MSRLSWDSTGAKITIANQSINIRFMGMDWKVDNKDGDTLYIREECTGDDENGKAVR